MASVAAGGVQAKPGGLITREAARDLSSYQYHAMTVDSNGRIDYADSSAATNVIGILQNAPTALGAEAEVATEGTSLFRVTGSGTVTIMCKLGSDGSYHGAKVTADKAIYFAEAMEASSTDDDLIEVKLLGTRNISV
jgi:hypothetical protein